MRPSRRLSDPTTCVVPILLLLVQLAALPSRLVFAGQAAEAPRQGGTLTFAVGAEPASLDGHREDSFATIHPVAPHYSLLVKVNQDKPSEIVGDLAESWAISKDGLTYTFKIRDGVRFHDGSPLTARDVKATYDRIISPPPGVVSLRQATYAPVDRVEAPDARTVVFRLKWPSAAMMANLASPFNFVYKADILANDPRWYETHVMGSGPFKFVEYVRGSHWVGKKNEDYFMKDRPYLDGFRALFIRDTGARVAALRGGRVLIEFRGFSPAARDELVRALGEKLTVQESEWLCTQYAAVNHEKKPFDDPRVRRALTLAIDRWEMSRVLSRIAIVKTVGGLVLPSSPYAMPEAELTKVAGFWKDPEASRREARRLLREAGVPEGFSFTFKNRAIPMPYESIGVYFLDQWRKVGLNVRQVVQETGPYFADIRAGNYETSIDFQCGSIEEPDLELYKFVSSDKSPINYSRYKDPVLDQLYEAQSRATDPEARRKLIWQFERRVLDEQAHTVPTLWWHRIVPHWARVKGWKITASHYLNQDLRDVWLAPE
jgi:peptide/nickel transport system substrate-binding protein